MGTIPMVTMAQSAANWCNTHTRVDCTFTYTLTITQLQPRAKPQLSYCRIWNRLFILNILEGGGANSTRRKPLTACPLIGNTLLEEKIQKCDLKCVLAVHLLKIPA